MGKKRLYFYTISMVILVSCSGHRNILQEAALSMPTLGAIVQEQKTMVFSSRTMQMGLLKTDMPIKVQVRELPFNAHSYTNYAKHVHRAGKINTIPYNDSLPYKPKYLRLQLQDHIHLQTLLNSKSNQALQKYLQKDDGHALVTAIDITAPDSLLIAFSHAEIVVLEQNTYGSNHLLLINGKTKRKVHFSEIRQFDYQLHSFCWGIDNRNEKRIVHLLGKGQKCPKDTYKKASKATKSNTLKKFLR